MALRWKGFSMYDVIVIGAGPAGATAAIEVHDYGLKTLLIDEGRDAGGQVWRPKSKSILSAPETDTTKQGNMLRKKLNESDVERIFETRVWQIELGDDGCWLLGLQGANQHDVQCRSLIIATGAQEKIIPVPGWTKPGVLGLAGATALFKEHMMVPGRRTIIAGNGPLLFYVASEVVRLGGIVSAVVTLNSISDWFKALPAMMLRPALLFQGIKWVASLYLRRIPIYWRHGVKSIEGHETVEGATLTKVNQDWRPVKGKEIYIHGESICIGHGLIPAIEATRLAGASHHYDVSLGGWVPTIDEFGRTDKPGLYACGDNAGILGVGTAPLRGMLAAKALYEDLSGQNGNEIDPGKIKRATTFGKAMTALAISRKGVLKFIDNETEVCRCESITKASVLSEIKHGALSHNAVKSGTRCGMGPCGGRYCMETVAMMTEDLTGKTRQEIGLPTARPPLRPVTMNELSEDLDYDDLPIPGISPL